MKPILYGAFLSLWGMTCCCTGCGPVAGPLSEYGYYQYEGGGYYQSGTGGGYHGSPDYADGLRGFTFTNAANIAVWVSVGSYYFRLETGQSHMEYFRAGYEYEISIEYIAEQRYYSDQFTVWESGGYNEYFIY